VCLNHFGECHSYICACQNHTACDKYTLRVEISLCVWKSYSACINYTAGDLYIKRQIISFPAELLLCRFDLKKMELLCDGAH
jgi:hypothetical protein